MVDTTLKCPLWDKCNKLLMKMDKKTLVDIIREQMTCQELVKFVRENE